MTLTADDRVRYARQVLLPEVGSEGQVRLLAAQVRIGGVADEGAAAVAREYLERAGVRVVGTTGDERESAHAHGYEDVYEHVYGNVDDGAFGPLGSFART